MSVITVISIGTKRGQVVIQNFDGNKAKSTTVHIARDRNGFFRDKRRNIFAHNDGTPPRRANTTIHKFQPKHQF